MADEDARSRLLANLAALAAASLFGASVVAVRAAGADIPPLNLGVLRFTQGAAVLLIATAVISPKRLRVRRRDAAYLALLGFLMFAAFPFTFNTSLRYTEASRGALLLASMPIWSVVLARRLADERLTRGQTLGVVMTFAGVVVVLAERGLRVPGAGSQLVGDALMLLTALLGAVYGVLAPRAIDDTTP